MKFLCFLLFSLILVPSAVFAQTEEKPQAYKFFEFGKISDELLREKVEAFRVEIVDIRHNKAKGIIIHYRKQSEISSIDKKIRNSLPNCSHDGEKCGRMRFVIGNAAQEGRTEFWIVPSGAEDPELVQGNKTEKK